MNKDSKIFVAGHKGMVGSAILLELKARGYGNILVQDRKSLDLTRQSEVEKFFEQGKIEYVFLAAARVGGIYANSTYPAEFIYENLSIATNIVHASYKFGVKKLLNLGSSCIYPKLAPQPIKEEYLLSGPLESTNEAYAVAKITAIKLCRYYNQQYGTNFLSVMPTNLYGTHDDHYDLKTSHVLPALIRKFHLAKCLAKSDYPAIHKDIELNGHLTNDKYTIGDDNAAKKALLQLGITADSVTLWGTGLPYRELLHVDDLAFACVFLMEKYDAKDIGEHINIGSGKDLTIKELAELVSPIIGYQGKILWDSSKPDGTPRKFIDSSKIKNLGWEPKIGLKDGIRMVYKEYVRRGGS